jgi:hypothetical protein
MEHRFGQRIRQRELPELPLEVDRSPTPVEDQAQGEAPAVYRYRGDRRANGAVPKGRVPPLEDAYSARLATRIGHMSGRLELEALHDEPGDRKDRKDRKEGLALQAWGIGRRAPSTLAAGDELPMNPHEMHEDG